MSSDSREDVIREMAYAKWEHSGCPSGDGVNFWLEAEQEFAQQQSCDSQPTTPARRGSIKAALVAADPPPLKLTKSAGQTRKKAS